MFKPINKALKTLTFALGGSDQITISSRCSKLLCSLRGTKTASGSDTVTTLGILASVKRLKIDSDKHGNIVDIDGKISYYLSKVFFNTADLTQASTGTSETLRGWEFILPVGCEAGEVLTVTIEWADAYTDIGSATNGYTGVLTIVPEMDESVSHKFGFKKQFMGASGVVGASAEYSQPTIPTVNGHSLVGELLIAYTSGPALADALSTIKVSPTTGVYVVDITAQIGKTLTNGICFTSPPTGVYLITHNPIPVLANTQLTIGNGGTATVTPSCVCYIYLRDGSGIPAGPTVVRISQHLTGAGLSKAEMSVSPTASSTTYKK